MSRVDYITPFLTAARENPTSQEWHAPESGGGQRGLLRLLSMLDVADGAYVPVAALEVGARLNPAQVTRVLERLSELGVIDVESNGDEAKAVRLRTEVADTLIEH